jgi:two-component system, NarL family, invasion response regulator UvrY
MQHGLVRRMKILIVDDHPIVRAGVRRLLAGNPDGEIAEAASAQEALTLAKTFQPDLLVLDLNLPGMGSFDIIARLTRETRPPQILVLSMHEDPVYAKRALEAGANGYVSKNAPVAQIVEAVARLADGQTFMSDELAQQLASWNSRPSSHPLHHLSRRDLEILRLLAEGRNIQQIADALQIGYKTVANNSSLIKAKLGIKRTAELIRFATRELSRRSEVQEIEGGPTL